MSIFVATAPTATAAPANGTAPSSARAQLHKTAQQFEAIMVRQMLAAARKTDFGDKLFGSEAMGTFREMQDDRYADVVAGTGTLGLAKMIETHMAKFLPQDDAAATPGSQQHAAATQTGQTQEGQQ